MKILMAHKFFYYGAGADKYFLDLAKLMESHGHQVIPFAMKHPRNLESAYSDYFVSQWDYNASALTTRIRNACKLVHSFEAAKAMERLIADTSPDIAHLHHIYHQLSSSVIYPLTRAGIPIVQTVHDYRLVCPNYKLFNPRTGQPCSKCLGHKYYHAIFERCHKGSMRAGLVGCVESYWTYLTRVYRRGIDRFTVSNEHLRDKLSRHGIPPERIEIIPNFVDTQAYLPQFHPDGYVLYFGRVSAEKGVSNLIRAMEPLPNLQLRIVGDGDQLEDLSLYVKEHGLTNVQFLGPAWDEDLKPILADAMFVVMPPVWPENSPFVIYQAFAAGKPVIASRVGGIPDLIDDGVDGLLYDAQDIDALTEKIRFLAERPALIREMGSRARAKAEREYDPEGHYRRMLDVYEEVLRRA
jgi:glycosyltransferase involved in cell wall biosynthesis